jgi:hypothetical protein
MATGSTDSFSPEAGSMRRGSRTGESEVAGISENDDGVRNLKASESVAAAFHAEGFPSPPAGIADIISTHVKSSTRDIPLNKIANMSPGSGALGTAAAAGVNMFLTMLTPAQREAAKAGVNPLDPAAVLRFSAMLNQQLGAGGSLMAKGEGLGGGGRVSSDAYTRELVGGSIYKALAAEGYTPGQITSAINYARDLGTSEDMARKFIKLDQTSRDDLHTFVDGIRNDPTLTDEQKQAKVAEYRKQHPKAAKVLTDKDMLKIIRGDEKLNVQRQGVQQHIHDGSQVDRATLNHAVGVDQIVAAAHRADVAKSESKPEEAAANLDVFAAAAQKAKAREIADAKPDSPTKTDETAVAKADAPTDKTETTKVARASVKSPRLG